MNQPQQQTPPEAWTERTRLLFGALTLPEELVVGMEAVEDFAP